MYRLTFRPKFLRKSTRLTKKNPRLKHDLVETLRTLAENPFAPMLKTHKVTDIKGDSALSSSVTGDIRIIWDFSTDQVHVLELLDIGGHSGKHKVYRK